MIRKKKKYKSKFVYFKTENVVEGIENAQEKEEGQDLHAHIHGWFDEFLSGREGRSENKAGICYSLLCRSGDS